MIVFTVLVGLQFAAGAAGLWHVGAALEGWVLALVILLSFLMFFGYFAAFEALNGGRTPGKQALGIRVVMETGHAVTATAAKMGNLVRMLDCYFPRVPALAGLDMIFTHPC